MVEPEAIWDLDNLRRAWRWIRSNPDAAYKSYFRESYGIYSVDDESMLAQLRDRLRRGVYRPSVATKIFLPKPSGVLRPYSLLTIEDQIAYQAAVNVVADQLLPRVRHRYLISVFGHLYAGRRNVWFYRKWSTGFQAFNKAASDAFSDGLTYTASFDLTAFYDSIDHGVLTHFLRRLGCSVDFCRVLSEWLTVWTATDRNIFHNHGIPQGPLSSGLLAETVLTHLDDGVSPNRQLRYFRYVDDVRLFARSELALRRALYGLDRLSKDVGLFPQSSKISIHEIKDIQKELKSISQPVESAVRLPMPDQAAVQRRLVSLSRRFKITDTTRFKYVLAYASPRAPLTDRLWRIYAHAPHLYDPIARYLARYDWLPDRVVDRLTKEVIEQTLYHAVAAAFVRSATGRVKAHKLRRFRSALKRRWQPRVMQADLAGALLHALAPMDGLTERQHEYAISYGRGWWVRTQAVLALKTSALPTGNKARLANMALTNECNDVAVAAAWICGTEGYVVSAARRAIRSPAKEILKKFGLLRRGGPRECYVDSMFTELTGATGGPVWRRFLARNYRHVEKQLVSGVAYSKTSATAWINCMDVLNDWLLIALYQRDAELGKYEAGKVGSVMGSTQLSAKYPAFAAWVQFVHRHRYESQLSHAKAKKTGRPTRALKFSIVKKACRLLREAVQEFGRLT